MFSVLFLLIQCEASGALLNKYCLDFREKKIREKKFFGMGLEGLIFRMGSGYFFSFRRIFVSRITQVRLDRFEKKF